MLLQIKHRELRWICYVLQMPHKTWFSYVGKVLGDRGFYFLPTVPDISANCHNSLSDSPDEFGWKWKVRQKLKLA